MAAAGGDSVKGCSYSTEERMKSVDRDFVGNGYVGTNWIYGYSFLALGLICMFVKIWKGFLLHGLSFDICFQMFSLPLFFITPLIPALLFRRYIRSALKEELISERVAENCEYWIGKLIVTVYLVYFWYFMQLKVA
jgi:hypothetical protein